MVILAHIDKRIRCNILRPDLDCCSLPSTTSQEVDGIGIHICSCTFQQGR